MRPNFNTMRVPLLRGRAFRENDDEKAPLVAIVNQKMAHEFWPNEDPIGMRFSLKSATGPYVEIVGVAGEGKYVFIGWDREPYFMFRRRRMTHRTGPCSFACRCHWRP